MNPPPALHQNNQETPPLMTPSLMTLISSSNP